MKNKLSMILLGFFTFFLTGIMYGQAIDLKINIKCPGNAFSGQDLKNTIKVYVTNLGKKTARNFPVDLIISKNKSAPMKFAVYSASFKEDALLLGGREYISYLTPGQTKLIKLNGKNRIPADTQTGLYFLGAIVDARNKLPETNENNNKDFCRIRISKKSVLPVLRQQKVRLNKSIVSPGITRRVVSGSVKSSTTMQGVRGIRVEAYYHKAGSIPSLVGICNTDSHGRYTIDYTNQSISTKYIDLKMKCYDGSGRLLVESGLIRNVPPIKTVDLIIPD